MNTHEEMVSRDGHKYILTVMEDIIKLSENQISEIRRLISKRNSIQVESPNGINLRLGNPDQKKQILAAIQGILNNLSVKEILDLQIVDFTHHGGYERISDEEICIDRDWNYDKADEEVVETLQTSYDVEGVRIRFNASTKQSWNHFAFRVVGIVDGVPKDVVIYFEPDPEDASTTIMVVTIL